MNPNGISAMKQDIQTLEEFDAIGTPGRVALIYGVDHADAHLYRKELIKRKREEPKLKNTTSVAERIVQMKAEVPTIEAFKKNFGGSVNALVKKFKVSWIQANKYVNELNAPGVSAAPAEAPVPEAPHSEYMRVRTDAPEFSKGPDMPEIAHTSDSELQKAIEEFHTNDAPTPVELPKIEVKPVQIKEDTSREALALELLTCVETIVSKKTQNNAAKTVNGYFAKTIGDLEERLTRDCAPADMFMIKRDIEYLKVIQADVLKALETSA